MTKVLTVVLFYSAIGNVEMEGLILSFGLVLVIASLETTEAVSTQAPTISTTTNCECESPWISFVDRMAALVLGFLWALRTWRLRQSYSSDEAPHWASMRRDAFWLSMSIGPKDVHPQSCGSCRSCCRGLFIGLARYIIMGMVTTALHCLKKVTIHHANQPKA